MLAISSTAERNAPRWLLEGLLKPLIFLQTAAKLREPRRPVTGGSKLKRVFDVAAHTISTLTKDQAAHWRSRFSGRRRTMSGSEWPAEL